MFNTNPNPYEATVLADSIADGVRLTTFVVTMPRIVLAEFNTHKILSRNSASSRAIPVKKRIKAVKDDPFIPLKFGKNQRGMSAEEVFEGCEGDKAREVWNAAMEEAVEFAKELADIGVHKQLANRILEPFSWQTILFSATELDNYFALRISEHAQPEIKLASEGILRAYQESTPNKLFPGEWHTPLISDRDVEEATDQHGVDEEFLVKLSSARCARVSYLTHGGTRETAKDIELYERLVSNAHLSPLEHCAQVYDGNIPTHKELHEKHCLCNPPEHKFIGNFRFPWIQHRKMIPGEFVFVEKE